MLSRKKTRLTNTQHSPTPLDNTHQQEDNAHQQPLRTQRTQWVVVEMGGEPLETFKHPQRAIYILGRCRSCYVTPKP
jgi:hypothetical protein